MRTRVFTQNRAEEGFTLLEVIIAVFIISVLSLIAMPSVFDKKRDNVDGETVTTLRYVADTLNEHSRKGDLGYKTELKDIATAVKKSGAKGTVLKLQRYGSEFCLTAYNPDGSHTKDNPIVFDSRTDAAGEVSYKPTDRCSNKLASPAFVVNDVKELELLEAPAPTVSMCNTVADGEYNDSSTFVYAQTSQGAQQVELRGYWILNADCTALDYNLRVINADPAETYRFKVSLSTMKTVEGSLNPEIENTPFTWLTIVGTETIDTTQTLVLDGIPTGWTLNTKAQELWLRDDVYNDAAYTPNDVPNWTSGVSL